MMFPTTHFLSTRCLYVYVVTMLACNARIVADDLPTAEPPYFRVQYQSSDVEGELKFGVSYTIWIPPDVKVLRGIVVHQHGCGEGACRAGRTAAFDLHWQALAEKHNCALLGPSYEQPEKADCQLWSDPRNGSAKKYLQGLEDLAAITRHPELTSIPWVLWGHSGGASWAGGMTLLYPERVAALWLRSGSPRIAPREGDILPPLDIPPAAYSIPMMCNQGTKEGYTIKAERSVQVWDYTQLFFHRIRDAGGPIGIAIDPLSGHECGNQRYLAIPWLDACMTMRLPDANASALKPYSNDAAWLVSFEDQRFGKPEPALSFRGDPKQSIWLPNERLAKQWSEYVRDTNVRDETPPPAPTDVQFTKDGALVWKCKSDLESGIARFIIEREGLEIGRVPSILKSPYGRPIFQINSYSDTPSLPLSEMKFVDSEKVDSPKSYRVRAVNSFGLESEASMAK